VSLRSILLFALLASSLHLSPAAEFRGLGFLPQGTFSSAFGISADGKVIVGSANINGSNHAVRYVVPASGAGSFVDLGAAIANAQAEAVSSDGRRIVGTINPEDFNSQRRAFVWDRDRAGGAIIQVLPFGADADTPAAHGVSGDGTIIVGDAIDKDRQSLARHPYVWKLNPASGNYDPEYLPNVFNNDGLGVGRAFGVSGSGAAAVTVGEAQAEFGLQAAFFLSTSAQVIDLSGQSTHKSSARAISSSGGAVVGVRDKRAFRWMQQAGFVDLGDFTGALEQSRASAISADETQVVGAANTQGAQVAFIWDPGNGMRKLADVLAALSGPDVNVTGWTLTEATAISDDGTVIAGNGTDPQGNSQAWLAKLPAIPVILLDSPTLLRDASGPSFSYQVRATRNPTSYAAPQLPAGLQINPGTGLIT
jgi:uncharacterized membrane protein